MNRLFVLSAAVVADTLVVNASAQVRILAVSPAESEIVATVTPVITMEFSGRLSQMTVQSATVRLYKLGEAEPTPGPDDSYLPWGTLSLDAGDTRLSLTPAKPLADGRYAVVVYGTASARSGPGSGLYFSRNVSFLNTNAFRGLAEEFTLEAWVRFDDWSEYGDHTYGAVIDVGKNGRYVPGFWLSHVRGDALFGFNSTNGTTATAECVATGALVKREWRHLAGVSSPDGLRLYVNGELAAEVPNSFRPMDLAASIETALTGYSRWAGAYDYVLGMFDEMRVWNVARTQHQVRATMHTPLAGNEHGLVLYHPLDESGNQIVDVSGHGHHGQLNYTQRRVSEAPLMFMPELAILDAQGVPIDADGDGVPGGVFVRTFGVDTTGPRIVALQPDLISCDALVTLSELVLRFDDALDATTLRFPAPHSNVAEATVVSAMGTRSPFLCPRRVTMLRGTRRFLRWASPLWTTVIGLHSATPCGTPPGLPWTARIRVPEARSHHYPRATADRAGLSPSSSR
jgi:hypothetical protein